MSGFVEGSFDAAEIIEFRYIGTVRPVDRRDPPADTRPTVFVSRTSLSGAPGSIEEITVTPSTATVQGSSTFRSENGSIAASGAIRSITLPSEPGRYTLTASAPNYNTRTISITVTGDTQRDTQLGTLTIAKEGAQQGTFQGVIVRATPAPSSPLAFRVTGGSLPANGEILTSGIGRTAVQVPATGVYVLTVRAEGYNPRQARLHSRQMDNSNSNNSSNNSNNNSQPCLNRVVSILVVKRHAPARSTQHSMPHYSFKSSMMMATA